MYTLRGGIIYICIVTCPSPEALNYLYLCKKNSRGICNESVFNLWFSSINYPFCVCDNNLNFLANSKTWLLLCFLQSAKSGAVFIMWGFWGVGFQVMSDTSQWRVVRRVIPEKRLSVGSSYCITKNRDEISFLQGFILTETSSWPLWTTYFPLNPISVNT